MPMYNAYGSYNPYNQQLMQNRLANMEQQYPQQNYQQMNQMQQQMNTQQYIKGRPVSSFDEAKASMIDLDGSLFVFTDIANKRIYTKQILLDGSAELKSYKLEERNNNLTKTIKTENDEYVLRSEFENAMKEINAKIKEAGFNESDGEDDK